MSIATPYSGHGGGYGGQITGSDQYSGGVTDYDANGNPKTSSGDIIGAGNRLLSDGTYNYTYDLAGNMLSQTNISTGTAMYFGYDADNRMVSVVMKNGSDQETAAVAYTYDMYGDLIGQTVTNYSYSGGQQYSSTYSKSFVYDLATGQMDLEFSGSTLQNRFLYGPAVDEILASESVASNPLYASTNWMVTNYQGSVVDELYQQDTEFGVGEFNHVAYNTFGAVTSGNAAQFGYDGTWTDPVTGMQLHDRRWYLPSAQRWTQPDPSGLGPDSNPNRYVGNDPVNATDPTGLAGEDDDDDDARESAQAVQQAAILRRNAAETGELQLVRAEAVKAGVDPAIIAKVDEEVAPRVQAPETPPDEEDPLYDAIVTLDKAIGEKEAQDAPAGGIRISPAEYARYKADEAAMARAIEIENAGPLPNTEQNDPHAGQIPEGGAPGMLQRYLEGSGGRWGGAETRQLNDRIATQYENDEEDPMTVTNGAGRGSEEWIPGPSGGTKGGTWVDITGFRGDGSVTRIQTIDTESDGETPTGREDAAAGRIRTRFPDDELILIPKPK